MNVQEINAISDFKAFSTINYNLPLYFIIYTLLLENFMLENFRDYALTFLKWFDVDRYRHAYKLSDDEFNELKSDLEKALNLLENYNERDLVDF